ncbi:MAG: outer membrane lipoprotein-sorting protein [Desulfobulbaceae bacterium]|nr:outer membrane lipoprotein-sorting protein [Desulfobulbaceae bacterium]
MYLFTTKLLLIIFTLIPLISFADQQSNSTHKGLTIMQRAEELNKGFGDYTATMRMVLRNRLGDESERAIRIMVLETAEDGEKSLSIFDTPFDVKGTGFLTHSHKHSDDDQWLYLPALKRVKRIAARNKSGSFMSSEFSYEDIAGRVVEKYNYNWLRDELFEKVECFVIEEYPKDLDNSGYSKLVTWLDKQHYRVIKVDYYDRKNALLKTLTATDYQKYLDKYWRPSNMYMYNNQTGKSTSLTWSNYKFQQGLTDRDFDKSSLKRTR